MSSRAGAQSGGGRDHIYAVPARLEAKASYSTIAGTISICHLPAFDLFDPGSIYLYVSIYFVPRLELLCDPLSVSLHVSTIVGDSLVLDQVCIACMVTIRECDTRTNFIFLDMLDFDVILGMDRLFPYPAFLDFFTKNITLAMPSIPLVVWQGSGSHTLIWDYLLCSGSEISI